MTLENLFDFSPLLALGLGLAIGLEHAFESDHVAAVATRVSGARTGGGGGGGRIRDVIRKGIARSSVIGILWGAGHTTTLIIMGLLVYVLAIQIQDNVFTGLEAAVGVMLVVLGAVTILDRRRLFSLRHRHPHRHDDGTFHVHEHSHTDHRHGHKSYIIGLIHGLAGSGSLVVLTAVTLDSAGMVISFILIFGLGSIIGMTLISNLIGLPLALTSRAGSVQRIARYLAGAFSLAIGAHIIYGVLTPGSIL